MKRKPYTNCDKCKQEYTKMKLKGKFIVKGMTICNECFIK